MKAKLTVLSLVSISLAGFAPPVFAYLDPSTGSMILSAIVGVFATLGLAVKTYWYKIKAFFNGNQQARQATEVSSEQDEQVDKDS